MPIYKYEAYGRSGKELSDIIEANNPQAARSILRRQGIFVRSISEDREKKERELFPFLARLVYHVPRRDVGLFARQLGTLLRSGLPLDRSLSNIIDQTENEFLKKALIEIRASVIEGSKLSDALQKHPAIFPPMYNNLVSVGETTGTYEDSLIRLSDLERANEALRSKVTSALFYPIIMLGLLTLIIFFLLAVVFPQIKSLFVQMDAQLPFITLFFLWLSEMITSLWVLLPIASISGGTYAFIRWKATTEGRATYERLQLRLPLFGNLIRKAVLARFARNLSVMLENRVPLVTALQVVSRVVEHQTFEKDIMHSVKQLKEGKKLTDGLRDSTIVTQMLLGMLAAGEASDNVPEMIERVAEVLEDDVNTAVTRLSAMLEPVMMIVMGGTIVLIMLAIMLPMYELTRQIQI